MTKDKDWRHWCNSHGIGIPYHFLQTTFKTLRAKLLFPMY